MKKVAAFIRITALSLAAAMTLSGCATQKDSSNAPLSPQKIEITDEIAVEKAYAKPASVTVSSSLSKAFDGIDGYAELCFGYTSGGKYEPVGYEEYSSAIYAQYIASKEFYNMALEYDEFKDMSYEEFKKEMYSEMGIDPSAVTKYSRYKMFITVSYYGEDEDADHSAAAKKGFDFFAEKLSKSKTFSANMLNELKTVNVSIRLNGDVISVSAGYENKKGESKYIFKDETVSLYGEGYVLIGNKAVPADTESLYICPISMGYSDYDENIGEFETAIYNYSSSSEGYSSNKKDESIDLTDIAKKLPKLKKLYISHHMSITGFEGLKKYSSFSELVISDWHINDENAKILSNLSNVKKLYLYDVKEKKDIEWTAKAKFKELAFDSDHPRDDMLKYVYSMPNVTELKLSYCTDLDLNGIEGMKGLKKLEIDIDDYYNKEPTDFAPLAKLKSLEEFTFTGKNGRNFESIGRIKTLKSLTLSELRSGWEDEKIDLSGLASCTSIEYLDISSVDYSIFSAIPNMKKLKKIRFGEYSSPDGLDELAGLNSLEELIFEDHSTVDLKGASKLKKLKRITIIKSDIKNASEINGCPSLKYLSIEGGKYDVFDVEDIENNTRLEVFNLQIWNLMHYKSFKTMTSLKKLNIVSRSLNDEQIKDLKEAMPNCRIKVSLPEEEKDRDGKAKAEDDYISYAEPLKTEYVQKVRIETYDADHDYWDVKLFVKNCGDKPIESLTEFLKKNGFTKGCSEIYLSYPERDGIEYSEVIERINITDKGFDYDNRTVYLSVLSVPDDDYTDNCRYRTLAPGKEAEVLLHKKDSDKEK
ncbi:MAG: hypothetical protein K2N71_11550 [Oscillospiraceae bacterium]|nr:hypothetical protein [Oscillospiraceae bacterium]